MMGARTTARRGAAAPALLVMGVLAPTEASAHLVTTGLGPFYDGVGHFLLTPEDLVPAVALALLAGLAGARLGRLVLLVLPVAWLAGGLVGLHHGGAALIPPALTALALCGLGGLVALDCRLPVAVGAALAAAIGLLHGLANGMAMAAAGLGLVALAGIATALLVVLALLGALVVSLQRSWERVAVRVAGSWIAASGMLMLGWTLSARI
jgi:urease accessory protein